MKKGIIITRIFFVFIFLLLSIPVLAQSLTVKGKLLDVNGKPSKYGIVGILKEANGEAKNFVKCDENGNYSIKITKLGYIKLLFSIPSHGSVTVPIYNNGIKELTIDVTLAPYKYKDTFDNVGVAGTFNGYDIQSPENMRKNDDGTYSFKVTTNLKEIKYQLIGIEKNGRTINAPNSESYETDSTGDYRSIMKVTNGKAVIVFNPADLITKDVSPIITITGNDFAKRLYIEQAEYDKRIAEALSGLKEYINSKKNPQSYKFVDKSKYCEELLRKIKTEKQKFLKDYLKLMYISFSNYKPSDYDFGTATSFFESFEPDNNAWDLLPNAFYSYYNLLPNYKWNDLQEKYLAKAKNNSIVARLLANKLSSAKYVNDSDKLKKLHLLIKTKYANNMEAMNLLKSYPVESKIIIGKKIPDFKVVSIDNKDEIISKKTMLGKIYLIDFWATWCGPCVGEMDNLHKVYNKFHPKGFEILSFSLDQNVETVNKFRKDKWAMPWKNAFIGDTKGKIIAKNFEVIGIPKPILVSADGKILALSGSLRGEGLEKTLSRYFK